MSKASFFVSVALLAGACDSGSSSPSPVDAGADLAMPASSCTAAVNALLGPIDAVSTGDVTILDDTAGVRKVYVDASAGGINAQDSHPRLYLDLATATRVDVTDKAARTSTAWDLALKRPVLFTNDGDGGPGMGGVIVVGKAFADVTAADASGTFDEESFVDSKCNPTVDQTGAPLTTMTDWYDYDQQTNKLTPKDLQTFIVRGGTGKLYKLGILDYYANPDGTTGALGGHFLLEIAAL